MTPLSRTLRALVLALALLLPAAPVAAQERPFTLPPGFAEEQLVEGLGAPTAFALSPDGRIFIALKPGRVKVIRNGELQGGAWLDLSGETNHYADRGMMGLALHPDFPNTPYVYVAYAWEPGEAAGSDPSGARSARVVRFTADPKDPNKHLNGSGLVLLGAGGTVEAMGDLDRGDRAPFSCMGVDGNAPVRDCLPVDGPSHTVDNLAFGPDGKLYISVGDGTLQPELNVRAQNLDSLAGKILRVDPATGNGLPDNPFYDGDPTSNRSKVWALGVRNPFRFSFDAATGELWLGDVGGERWEEINLVTAGANLGWPCFEGAYRNNNGAPCPELAAAKVTQAVHAYPHEGEYSAAIGGVVYRGEAFPQRYRRAYFFADHNRAAILALLPDGRVEEFATHAIAPVQVSEGADGALYVLSFVTGTLSRVSWVGGGNSPPVAVIAATPQSGDLPLAVEFSGEESRDPDGGALTFHWDFRDGSTSSESNPLHVYAKDGRFDATLTVTDESGLSRTATIWINAGASAPVVTIEQPTEATRPAPGDVIPLRGSATDAQDGDLPDAALRWTGVLHHNEHVHVDYLAARGAQATLTWDDHGENTWMELCLSATDSEGLEGRSCVRLESGKTPRQGANTEAESAPAEIAAAEPVVGGLARELWSGLSGDTVEELTGSDRFPDAPDKRLLAETIDFSDGGKDYGERLRGYFVPPTDGEYVFWIASDDGSALWLSGDDSPAGAERIAFVPGWTSRRQWDKFPEQQSRPLTLTAGTRYYIEVLHKQANQKDNLSVAFQVGGGERTILDSTMLRPLP